MIQKGYSIMEAHLVEDEVKPGNELVHATLQLDQLGRILRNKLRILHSGQASAI